MLTQFECWEKQPINLEYFINLVPSMKNIQIIKPPTEIYSERIILLSGNGQNVGKTTFACHLIQHLKKLNQQVYALKISPHFHTQAPPNCIFSDERYILSLEKDSKTGKDSSRYVEAGAHESFILQVRDEYLLEAIHYTFSMIPKEVIVIIESGAFRRLMKPALFLFLMRNKNDELKESAKGLPELADKIIIFDGQGFDTSMDSIQWENKQFIFRNS